MRKRRWTAEDDSFLRERWQYIKYSNDVVRLADRLNRSIPEIRTRAYKLKTGNKTNWTEEELQFLKATWSLQSALEISKVIPRSEGAIQSKAKALELRGGQKRAARQNRMKNVVSPNKPEIILDSLLQANFTGEYRFNGNYSQGVTLGGLVPDWINVNGRKQVIELFGDYWHDKKKNVPWKSTEFGRKAVYSQLGFECLVIWEHELESPTDVIEKVKSFQ